MRSALLWCSLVACAAHSPAAPEAALPIDTVWADSLHAGDLIVLVPGTGAYDFLAATIEPLGPDPLVDPRAIALVADDSIVFEQAIAAAHRAGVSPDDLTFGLWGAGFTKLDGFEYLSYEGLRVHIAILGGENSCATGRILENLVNYNRDSAERDATDLYARIGSWLAAHPATPEVVVASHSWGGAVAEYAARELATAPVSVTIAAGVPGTILDYPLAGPGLRDVAGGKLYEIDRPDDPVHAMNPSGDPNGHQYTILYGDAFQGSYGVTTTELSCAGVPGACGPH